MKDFLRKTANGFLYGVTALLLPASISFPKNEKGKRDFQMAFPFKKIAIFALVYGVIQPLSLFLFPRAEDVIKKEGLDSKAITELTSAKDIRIISDNLAGKTYFLFNAPPLFKPYSFARNMRLIFNDHAAGTYINESPDLLVKPFSRDVKKIYMKDVTDYNEEMIKDKRQLTEFLTDNAFTYQPKLTPHDNQLITLCHEIRHTDPKHFSLPPLQREGDAEFRAGVFLAKQLKRPDFLQNMINENVTFQRAQGSSDRGEIIHDTALYMYLRAMNKKIPDEKVLIAINNEAEPVINLMIDGFYGDTDDDDMSKFKAAKKQLSPLANLKVDLYINAFRTQILPVREKKPASFKAS